MSDPTDRDRTLGRVRRTTAVTGIGTVLVGGALAGWLGHAATQDEAGPDSGTSTTTDQGTTTDDDGLTSPTTAPESGGAGGQDAQPGVTSGGS
jgi:hypothetical protein